MRRRDPRSAGTVGLLDAAENVAPIVSGLLGIPTEDEGRQMGLLDQAFLAAHASGDRRGMAEAIGQQAALYGPNMMGAGVIKSAPLAQNALSGKQLYHSTTRDFDKISPSKRGAAYFAESEEMARAGAAASGQETWLDMPVSFGGAPVSKPRTIKAEIDGRVIGLDPLPEVWFAKKMSFDKWKKEIDGGWKQWNPPNHNQMTEKELNIARRLRLDVLEKFEEKINGMAGDDLSDYLSKLSDEELRRVNKKSEMFLSDLTPSERSYDAVEFEYGAPFRSLAKKLGYVGAKVSDEAGSSIAIFDGDAIRHSAE